VWGTVLLQNKHEKEFIGQACWGEFGDKEGLKGKTNKGGDQGGFHASSVEEDFGRT